MTQDQISIANVHLINIWIHLIKLKEIEIIEMDDFMSTQAISSNDISNIN